MESSNFLQPVYFKEAWTENSKIYQLNPEWSLCYMMDIMQQQLTIDFNLGDADFVLVLAGQNAGENAEPIYRTNDISLQDILGRDLNGAFYIRRL